MNAQAALMAFDSKPVKSKKQQKEEAKEFPSLIDEEPSLADLEEESKGQNSGAGGGKKGRKRGKKN